MGADLRTPFGPNCSEGSMAKPDEDGHYPVRIDTRGITQPPLFDGHLAADCSFGVIPADNLACPSCLSRTLRSFPERYRPITETP